MKEIIENYFKNKQSIKEINTFALNNLSLEYPYFHGASTLLALHYKEINSYMFRNALKKASLNTGDRTVLYSIINGEMIAKPKESEETIIIETDRESLKELPQDSDETTHIESELDSKNNEVIEETGNSEHIDIERELKEQVVSNNTSEVKVSEIEKVEITEESEIETKTIEASHDEENNAIEEKVKQEDFIETDNLEAETIQSDKDNIEFSKETKENLEAETFQNDAIEKNEDSKETKENLEAETFQNDVLENNEGLKETKDDLEEIPFNIETSFSDTILDESEENNFNINIKEKLVAETNQILNPIANQEVQSHKKSKRSKGYDPEKELLKFIDQDKQLEKPKTSTSKDASSFFLWIDKIDSSKETSLKDEFNELLNNEYSKKKQIENSLVENQLSEFLKNSKEWKNAKEKNISTVLKVEVSKEIPEIVSESLATIYHEQGLIDKAKDIYHKLSLQNPKKKSYFANLIKNLNE